MAQKLLFNGSGLGAAVAQLERRRRPRHLGRRHRALPIAIEAVLDCHVLDKKINGHFFFAGLGEATLQTVWPDDLEDDDIDAEDGLNPGPFWHRAEVERGSEPVWSSAAAKVSAEDMDDPSKEIAIVIDAADDDDDVDKSGAKKLRRRVTTEDLYCDDEFQETNLVSC